MKSSDSKFSKTKFFSTKFFNTKYSDTKFSGPNFLWPNFWLPVIIPLFFFEMFSMTISCYWREILLLGITVSYIFLVHMITKYFKHPYFFNVIWFLFANFFIFSIILYTKHEDTKLLLTPTQKIVHIFFYFPQFSEW